jgi:dTDP-4-amino-4,6-dideoxygalactose transaminase
VRRAINFGFDDEGDVAGPGLNGKLSEVAAAVGLAVLAEAPASLQGRLAAGAAWLQALQRQPELTLPHRPGRPPWQTLPVLLDATLDASAFVARLAEHGLQARRYYRPALHQTPAFACGRRLPVTEALAARMVCLPVYADQTAAELDEMAAIVTAALAGTRLAAAA